MSTFGAWRSFGSPGSRAASAHLQTPVSRHGTEFRDVSPVAGRRRLAGTRALFALLRRRMPRRRRYARRLCEQNANFLLSNTPLPES